MAVKQVSRPGEPGHDRSHSSQDLFSPEFLRIIGMWSVIPTYLIAGGLLGWLADYILHTFPFGIAVGLLAALALSVRDSMRLRNEFHRPKEPSDGDSD